MSQEPETVVDQDTAPELETREARIDRKAAEVNQAFEQDAAERAEQSQTAAETAKQEYEQKLDDAEKLRKAKLRELVRTYAADGNIPDNLPIEDWTRLRNAQLSGELDKEIRQAGLQEMVFRKALADHMPVIPFAPPLQSDTVPYPEMVPFPGDDIDATVQDVEQRIIAKHEAQKAAEAEMHERQQALTAYDSRLAEAKQRHKDWTPEFAEQTSRQMLTLSPATLDSLTSAVIDLPNGPDVMHWLGSNPQAISALRQLNPRRVAMAITRLGAELERPASPAATIRTLPKPVTPIEKVTPGGHVDLNDPKTPSEAWYKERNRQLRAKGKLY